jgi:hypothetical protein
MTQAFLWTAALALALILLLESASLFPKGTPLHRLSMGGFILLVAGVILGTFRLMVVHQVPSFSLAPSTFFLTFPS